MPLHSSRCAAPPPAHALLLVQVAALGLDPHKHLGRSLAALEHHLLRLAATFGCNPCGEGGEYETLTLDCPLFSKGRLVLHDWQVRDGWG